MLNFVDADTTQKATGATSAQIDFVCVICTSNSSTAAVASLSLPLSVCEFVQGYLTTISPFIYLPFYFFAATGHHPTEGGCAGGDKSIDTSYHRHSSSLEDWDAACGLGYRRRWW